MDNLYKFICCGSVDDGKSTLLGRLLLNTGNIKEDQLADARKISQQKGFENIELGLLLDGLLDEREQQITIDVAHRFFDFDNTRFHILDCPGHEQYTKNMAIAAAEAQAAVLVIDLTKGVSPQTLRHIEICSLFQIEKLCVCITKCDKLEWNTEAINNISSQICELLKDFNFDYQIIPVSAIENKNINKVLDCLIDFKNTNLTKENKKTLIHIQNCNFDGNERYYWGHYVEHNIPQIGDILTLYPEKIQVTIKSASENGLISINEDVDISRGHCLSNTNVIVSNSIKYYSVLFEELSNDLLLKHGTRTVKVRQVSNNTLQLEEPIIFNNITDIKNNGFGLLIDNKTKRTVGVAVFLANDNNLINRTEKGFVYWFTGLSGAGKTTLAMHLMSHFNIKPILLDADEIRKGINADLGFTAEDRYKNVFRIAQMADLLSSQGFNVVVTCISKDAKQRSEIKSLLQDRYIEIFVDRSLENCRKYDKKGLYKSIGLQKIVQGYECGNTMSVHIDTNFDTEEISKTKLLAELKKLKYIN